MKNFIFVILLIFNLFIPAFSADDKPVLPSQTGVVKSIEYEDTDIQGGQTTKQKVTVDVLTGDFKGTQRVIDNMLTGNPAYDIMLSKGDKVILHLEPLNDDIATADDVDFFIADIKRANQMWIFTAIFCALLLAIGKKKGARSIVATIYE